VARACKSRGLAKLPPLQGAVAIRRYERKSPGELLHMDTKKLHRFDKPGHRVTGDRTQNTPRAGSQALHVAIDDHSRVGFSLLLPMRRPRAPAPSCWQRCATTRPWASRWAAHDRQRFCLQAAPLCQAAAPPGHQAHPHPPLHTTHQRQGRTVHPDLAARMGLRLHLSKFGCPRQRAGALDVSLQLPPTSLSHFPPPSSRSSRI
jgi:hypothetical protein